MCSTALLVQTLQNICGTIGFYIINLLIYDCNANITLSQFDLWEKQEKLQIIGNQFSVEKKKESDNSFSIITLCCVGVIILYSVYFD